MFVFYTMMLYCIVFSDGYCTVTTRRILLLSMWVFHGDVIKWNHFPCHWSFVWGIHRSPVKSPHKLPVTRGFDVFCGLRPFKRLSKQSWGLLFETPLHSLWCHCNVLFDYLGDDASLVYVIKQNDIHTFSIWVILRKHRYQSVILFLALDLEKLALSVIE